MSYFSHNPEAWDEIERKGVARKLASVCTLTVFSQEEVEQILDCLFVELQCPGKAEDAKVWNALTEWANEEIKDQERSFWERMVP